MTASDRSYAVLFGAAALALYVLTLSPDVFWGDAAQLQYLSAEPRFGATPRSYPLYIAGSHLLWRLGPFSPAVATNLFSALCGAIAVGLAWLVARRESGTRLGGAVGAVTLAVSHLHWSSSASAEVYGLSALYLLLLLALVRPAAEGRRSAIVAAGAVVGLSLLHHRVLPFTAAAATIPILVVWVRAGRAVRGIGWASLGFLAGVLPFVCLLIASPEGPWRTFFDGAEFRAPGLAGAPAIALYVAAFLAFNFLGPQIILALVGTAITLRRPTCSGFALFAMLLTGAGLPFLYPHLGDRYIFLLPANVAVAIYAGIGAARIAGRWRPAWSLVLLAAVALVPPSAYALAASCVRPGVMGRFRGADPRHLAHTLWPGRAGRSEPRELALQVAEEIPEGALLVRHWGEGQVFLYLQIIESFRPDLQLVSAHGSGTPEVVARALAEERPVFLTTYPYLPMPTESARRFPGREIIPGRLWRLDQP